MKILLICNSKVDTKPLNDENNIQSHTDLVSSNEIVKREPGLKKRDCEWETRLIISGPLIGTMGNAWIQRKK